MAMPSLTSDASAVPRWLMKSKLGELEKRPPKRRQKRISLNDYSYRVIDAARERPYFSVPASKA